MRWLCPDSRDGYRWWTAGGGRTNAIGEWWLKIGPVTLSGFEFDGVPCVTAHLLNRWWTTLRGRSVYQGQRYPGGR